MFKTYLSAAAGAGTSGSGTAISSASAGATGPGGWHPTVLYMLVLVAAEILAVAFLSRHLLK